MLECTGQRAGLAAYVNLDENDVHTNYVVLNDRSPVGGLTRTQLTCAPAFAYKLDVTRTDLTG